MDLLGKLDAQCREVMILRYFEDIKLKDIATVTSENLNTVKSRLHRALKQLQIECTVCEEAVKND